MDSGEYVIPNNIFSESGSVMESGGVVITPPSSSPETVIIQEVSEDRPFLTTAFEDYTVMEGLLLLIVLCIWFYAVLGLLKNGFRWLKK